MGNGEWAMQDVSLFLHNFSVFRREVETKETGVWGAVEVVTLCKQHLDGAKATSRRYKSPRSPSGLPGRKRRLIGYLGGESRVANDAESSGRAIDVETRFFVAETAMEPVRFSSATRRPRFVRCANGTTRHRIVAFLVSVSATRLSYSTRSARPKTFFWESSLCS